MCVAHQCRAGARLNRPPHSKASASTNTPLNTITPNFKTQAFSHVALALCDPGDEVVLLAPYYFSHKLALQIAQATVRPCRWDPRTLLPDLQVWVTRAVGDWLLGWRWGVCVCDVASLNR